MARKKAPFNRSRCAGVYKAGPKKGRVKTSQGYRDRGPDECPIKLSAGKRSKGRLAKGCKDIAKRAFMAGIAKGRKLQAEHKATPKSAPATQAMMLRGLGLGRARHRRRRR